MQNRIRYGNISECESRVILPFALSGKTTEDVRPQDARKYFPKRHPWHDGLKYILLSVLPLRTPDTTLRRVHDKIVKYLHYVNQANPERLSADMRGFTEEVWPVLSDAMKYNRGMATLMDEYGWRSRFLARAVTVGAQAVLLELFHSGRTRSISGEFEYIPYEDAMIEMIIWEPISLCMYERRLLSQEQVMTECEKLRPGEKLRMASFGAGLLPVLRADDFPQDLPLEIVAIDMDDRNLENLKLVFDKPIGDYGVDYRVMNVVNYCNDPINSNSKSLVEAMGMLSYYRWRGETKRMVETFLKVVEPGGKLLCDLQLMNKHLVRCALSMGWKSKLVPELSWWLAALRMTTICRQLGVEVEFRRSRYLKHAAGINMIIYKPKPVSHREV